MELLPDFSALLRWFQAAELLSARDAAELFSRNGEIRPSSAHGGSHAGIAGEAEEGDTGLGGWGVVHHSTVDELNRLMADHPMRTRLKASERLRRRSCGSNRANPKICLPRWHTARRRCSPMWIAAASASVVSAYCIFYDTSKKGTRRWCSMQLCGNRLKVAAYAARQRAQSHKR